MAELAGVAVGKRGTGVARSLGAAAEATRAGKRGTGVAQWLGVAVAEPRSRCCSRWWSEIAPCGLPRESASVEWCLERETPKNTGQVVSKQR